MGSATYGPRGYRARPMPAHSVHDPDFASNGSNLGLICKFPIPEVKYEVAAEVRFGSNRLQSFACVTAARSSPASRGG